MPATVVVRMKQRKRKRKKQVPMKKKRKRLLFDPLQRKGKWCGFVMFSLLASHGTNNNMLIALVSDFRVLSLLPPLRRRRAQSTWARLLLRAIIVRVGAVEAAAVLSQTRAPWTVSFVLARSSPSAPLHLLMIMRRQIAAAAVVTSETLREQ